MHVMGNNETKLPAVWPRYMFCFVLGMVAALGHPPIFAWYAALPALVGIIWGIGHAATLRQATLLGWVAGTGYFALALNWITEPFLVDAENYAWMAPFAALFLSGGLALFWALAAGVSYRLSNHAAGRIMVFSLNLTFAELARGYVLTGFPWALVGHIWIDTPIAQIASWLGPSGLTLFMLLPCALFAKAAVPVMPSLKPALLGVALLLGATAYGSWALMQPIGADRAVTLRLVQPNAAQAMKWDPDAARRFYDRQIAFTAAMPKVDLVIWPETALPYIIDRHPELWSDIATAAQGGMVAVGMQRVEGQRGWNNLTVIGPDASAVASYDKHHLVPFGEYIPFGDLAYDWFGLTAFAAQAGASYSSGSGPMVLNLGPALGRVLPLICYEAVFPQDLRGTERPDWLLQVTNDAWFGKFSGPFQHAAQAQLRAIEQGLPLVRVANTGVTAVYDARGRTLAQLPFGVATYLDVALPGALPPTLYSKWGELPVLVLLCGLGLLLFLRRTPSSA
jgi:apolipoprotein N-acyltransferase